MAAMSTRRTFLGAASAAVVASRLKLGAVEYHADDLKLGVATYSLRKFARAEAIQMIQSLGVRYVSVKDFHAPRKSSAEELQAIRKEFEDAGLTILSGGNVTLSMKSEAELREAFVYAKNLGLKTMVCAPSKENIPAIEGLAKEFDIRLAIHNHGPEDKHFPSPESVLEAVSGRDGRLGLCIDIGHTSRAGSNIVESVKRAGPRLFDMHVKDLKNPMVRDSQVDVGDGALPFADLFRTLEHMNYQGGVMLEYEINDNAPLPGMQKSFAYMRGVLAGLRA